jgi:L-erythrulose 1-phosphate isomerase
VAWISLKSAIASGANILPKTDKTVGLKTAAAVRHGLIPLVCVGENLVEREGGRTGEVLSTQVKGAIQILGADALSAQIVFAYEPVWAIGEKGIPASSDYADIQHALIKNVATRFLPAVPKVLYGGSVTTTNCTEFASQPNIDGLFIGRSAWQPESYISILQLVYEGT